MNINWSIKSSDKENSYLKLLSNQIESDQISNCYLFVGPQGVGKEVIVGDFIKAIRCLGQSSKPCFDCRPCQQIDNKLDQNLVIIGQDKSSDSIKIEQIRELKERVAYRSLDKELIVWIKNAHQLTIEASNSILKTLEEKNSTIFILSADKIDFPKTIESRSQVVYIPPQVSINEKIDNSNQSSWQTILADSGLPYLSDLLVDSKIDPGEIYQLYKDLNNSSLSDRLGLVSDKVLELNLDQVIFLLILFEKHKFSSSRTEKTFQNLKMMMSNYKLVTKYNLNKKILLKNLFINYKRS